MISPRRILAIKLRSMGDTILLTAPLWELRKAFPSAEIHVAVTEQWAPLLEHHPAVQKILRYPLRQERPARAKASARLAIEVRKNKYDCVINFHASPSSSLVAFASGAKIRSIHFHSHKDRNRYSTVEIPGKGVVKPIIERDMDAIRALGVHIPEGGMPRIYLSTDEIEKGRNTFEQMNLPEPILALGLGASRPTKIWPVERFAALAISWAQQTGGSVAAISGPGEWDLNQQFQNQIQDQLQLQIPDADQKADLKKRIIQLKPYPLRELATVLRNFQVFAGNDSGPKHLAVSLDLPTVTLVGPEDPYEWHPYPKNRHPYLFIEGLPCRKDAMPGRPPWCGLEVCIHENHKCMRLIRVEQTLEECRKVLAECYQ